MSLSELMVATTFWCKIVQQTTRVTNFQPVSADIVLVCDAAVAVVVDVVVGGGGAAAAGGDDGENYGAMVVFLQCYCYWSFTVCQI